MKDEPKRCQQLILALIGKFLTTDAPAQLSWVEAEVVRFASRLLRPITPLEIAKHLRISDRHARRILHNMVDLEILCVASGVQRSRTFELR